MGFEGRGVGVTAAGSTRLLKVNRAAHQTLCRNSANDLLVSH